MSDKLSKGAVKFQTRLKELGIGEFPIKQLPHSVESKQDIAESVDCKVEQIATSNIFKMKSAGEALLVLTSGDSRVNKMLVEILIDDVLEDPGAEFVEKVTGYETKGIPPVAHSFPIMTFIDEELMGHDKIWATAGDSRAVFELTPKDLKAMTLAEVTNVALQPE